jgi:hypothetical protein
LGYGKNSKIWQQNCGQEKRAKLDSTKLKTFILEMTSLRNLTNTPQTRRNVAKSCIS